MKKYRNPARNKRSGTQKPRESKRIKGNNVYLSFRDVIEFLFHILIIKRLSGMDTTLFIVRNSINVPMLDSVCLKRSVYYTRHSDSQEIFVKFEAGLRRKCYTIENISKILRQFGKTEGNFMLAWNSGV